MILKIRLWFQTWKAMFMWISLARQVNAMLDEIPVTERADGIKHLNMFQQNIGNCLLHLVGVFPLEDSWGMFDDSPSANGPKP